MRRITLVTLWLVLTGLAVGLEFPMGGVAQDLPDLAVADLQLEPAVPKPGQSVRLTATVLNQGTATAQETFAVQFFAGRRVITSRFFSGLAAGQALAVEASWDAEGGESRLRVIADVFNKIPEPDKKNNTLTRVINVTDSEPTQSDLVIKIFELQPTNPRPGTTAQLSARVVNQGAGPAPAFDVGFESDGQPLGTRRLEGLEAGQEATVAFDWTVEIGERILRAKADPDGRMIETDESNNALAKQLDFGPAPASCAQQVFLEFEEATLVQLEDLTGLAREDVLHYFIPMIKRSMERDYEGVNVRFFYSHPGGSYTTILFSPENRGSILGLAPLDRGNFNKRDTAFVFIGSFVARGGLVHVALPAAAVLIGKVASHELGHALGLGHNGQGGIMNAEADLNPFSVQFATFRPEDLEYLKRILPMNC
jgi:hypothetical protein